MANIIGNALGIPEKAKACSDYIKSKFSKTETTMENDSQSNLDQNTVKGVEETSVMEHDSQSNSDENMVTDVEETLGFNGSYISLVADGLQSPEGVSRESAAPSDINSSKESLTSGDGQQSNPGHEATGAFSTDDANFDNGSSLSNGF